MKKRLFFLLTISLLLGTLNSEGQSVPNKTIQKDDISAGNKKQTRPELLTPPITPGNDIKSVEVVKPTNRFQKKVRGSKNVNQLNPQPLPPKDKGINQLNPQPLPPKAKKINQLNPQPLPPKDKGINQLNPQPLPPKAKKINQLNPQPLPPKAKKINQLNF